MKLHNIILIFILFFFSISGLNAQSEHFGDPFLPFQPNGSPLFGKDIIIHDSSSQNQQQIVICSAFNGWLYAGHTYFNTLYNCPAFEIFKSVDNGINWTKINDLISNPVYSYISLDLVVLGDSIPNLKLFVSFVFSLDDASPGVGYLDRFDGITGDWEKILIQNNSCYRIALSTDFIYPATNSNPHSLGVLYSAQNIFTHNQDSIIFCSSSNAGESLDNRKVLATTTGNKYHKVALTYGRSPSWSSGRYYAVWEEKDSYTSSMGHIFTAHSNPDFNSPFTGQVCIDSLDPSAINKVKNPKIACQFSSSDNDSSNLTEVIMLEKQLSLNNYDIRGFYNREATISNHFSEFTLNSSSNNKTQPDISFNLYNSSFMLTYYDSTLRSLPFLTNSVNLASPPTWNIINPAYNDSPNLTSPYPKVVLDFGQQQGANVWTKDGAGGNGISMFDAQYSTYTWVSENYSSDENLLLKVYPNPCNSFMTINFNLKKKGRVKIVLSNQIGETMGIVTERSYLEGQSIINYDVPNIAPGSYLITFIGENVFQTYKVVKVR